jgi:hypothetical protein
MHKWPRQERRSSVLPNSCCAVPPHHARRAALSKFFQNNGFLVHKCVQNFRKQTSTLEQFLEHIVSSLFDFSK